MQVSIHAPARGATGIIKREWWQLWVSIHAPARGATPLVPGLSANIRVSIHAPARGATARWWVWRPPFNCFYPRPRTGGDKSHVVKACYDGVSIHAPARGATITRRVAVPGDGVSIHAPARGATARPVRSQAAALVSIHAPARGATACAEIKRVRAEFLSTPPHGGRPE